MNWNHLLLVIPFIICILMIIGGVDYYTKRKFPNDFIKSVYWLLIVFPPIVGFAIYYYHVMKPNRYDAKGESEFNRILNQDIRKPWIIFISVGAMVCILAVLSNSYPNLMIPFLILSISLILVPLIVWGSSRK